MAILLSLRREVARLMAIMKKISDDFRLHEVVPFELRHELHTQKETLVLALKLQAKYVNVKLSVIIIRLLDVIRYRQLVGLWKF